MRLLDLALIVRELQETLQMSDEELARVVGVAERTIDAGTTTRASRMARTVKLLRRYRMWFAGGMRPSWIRRVPSDGSTRRVAISVSSLHMSPSSRVGSIGPSVLWTASA